MSHYSPSLINNITLANMIQLILTQCIDLMHMTSFQYGALALKSKGGCSLANLCAIRLFRHRLTSIKDGGWMTSMHLRSILSMYSVTVHTYNEHTTQQAATSQ